jgi:hypothetical protein
MCQRKRKEKANRKEDGDKKNILPLLFTGRISVIFYSIYNNVSDACMLHFRQ